MFRCVPTTSKIPEEYKKLPSSIARTTTPRMRTTIDKADKVKKGGKQKKMKEGPSKPVVTPKKQKAKIAPSIANPKRRKQAAHKRKAPTPSASEGSESDTQSEIHVEENDNTRNEDDSVRNEDIHIHNKEETSNLEVTQPVNDSVPSPLPSPQPTFILITITPYLPPVSSQPQTSIPISTPMFIDSTVPPTTSTTPLVSVNVSDTGLKHQVSQPMSPLLFPS